MDSNLATRTGRLDDPSSSNQKLNWVARSSHSTKQLKLSLEVYSFSTFFQFSRPRMIFSEFDSSPAFHSLAFSLFGSFLFYPTTVWFLRIWRKKEKSLDKSKVYCFGISSDTLFSFFSLGVQFNRCGIEKKLFSISTLLCPLLNLKLFFFLFSYLIFSFSFSQFYFIYLSLSLSLSLSFWIHGA